MSRVGGVVVPKNSSLPDATVHEYVENASDASKTSPTICLNLPLLIGAPPTQKPITLCSSASYEETRKKSRVEFATKRHKSHKTNLAPCRANFIMCLLCLFVAIF